MRTRIASPEMLLNDASLPHLICSREQLENGEGNEADEHGHAQGSDGGGRAAV